VVLTNAGESVPALKVRPLRVAFAAVTFADELTKINAVKYKNNHFFPVTSLLKAGVAEKQKRGMRVAISVFLRLSVCIITFFNNYIERVK